MPRHQICIFCGVINESLTLVNQRWCRRVLIKNCILQGWPPLVDILVICQDFMRAIILLPFWHIIDTIDLSLALQKPIFVKHNSAGGPTMLHFFLDAKPRLVTRSHADNSYGDKSSSLLQPLKTSVLALHGFRPLRLLLSPFCSRTFLLETVFLPLHWVQATRDCCLHSAQDPDR